MNHFGVFIRSVGERTALLCREAVAEHIANTNIHLIVDQTPAWRAYDVMFRIAAERGYAWYLGLDADVILRPDWLAVVSQKQRTLDPRRVYDCSFPVLDYFTGVVDKGNHLFNGRFTVAARRILLQHTKDSSKPESAIFSHLSNCDSFYFSSLAPIGWHGFEQYRRDIYYRFFLLGARGKRLMPLSDTPDSALARQAYFAGRREFYSHTLLRWLGRWRSPAPDTTFRDWVPAAVLATERPALDMSLTQFRHQYALPAHTQARPAYDLNRGTVKIPVQ